MFSNQNKIVFLFFIFSFLFHTIYGQEGSVYKKKIPIIVKLCEGYISPDVVEIYLYDALNKGHRTTTIEFSEDKKEAWLVISERTLNRKFVEVNLRLPNTHYYNIDENFLDYIYQTDSIEVKICKSKYKLIKFAVEVSFFSMKGKVRKEYAGNVVDFFYFKAFPKEHRKRLKKCVKR